MAGLVDVAHALGAAGSEEAVVQVLTAHCASAMGANGTVLVLRTTTDAPVARPGAALDAGQGPGQQSGQGTGEMAGVRALTSGYFDDEVRADVAVLPVGFPLPMVHTAMTGRAYFLGDRAAAVAAFPGGQDLYVRARTEASASVPLEGAGGTFGALAVAFADTRTWRSQDRNLLRALAALTAQALERIRALDAEMEAARAVGRLSETLQRALLTAPPQPDDLAIAARYQPAAQQAQVGGDWYDAFVNPDGNTTLVIGDVTGHDRDAAAAMAQTRNVLRGVAQALGQPPAAVLSLLDKALARLQVHTLATAVLCDIRTAPAFTTPPMTAPMIAAPTITTSMAPPAPDYQPSTASSDNGSVGGAAAGSGGCDQQEDPARGRILRWSNAGHPPPLLIQCDGTPVLLERTPDLLLGVDPDARRVDYEHHVLAVGDTVVLYTDGLIERRGEPLDQALTRLRNAAHDLAHLPLDDMVDALLERLASDAEDDVAVIALRPLAPAPH
jgi:serine phosphatase RsbU (regulator of sigma subunit)